MSDLAAPFDDYRDAVRPEWIDHDGHMSMGYYLVVFDYATDAFLAWVGLDEAHRRAHQVTPFCLETHVRATRGPPRRPPALTTLLLGPTPSACTTFTRCIRARGYLASTNELMFAARPPGHVAGRTGGGRGAGGLRLDPAAHDAWR